MKYLATRVWSIPWSIIFEKLIAHNDIAIHITTPSFALRTAKIGLKLTAQRKKEEKRMMIHILGIYWNMGNEKRDKTKSFTEIAELMYAHITR